MTEYDRLEAQYEMMRARQKAKEHSDAFMQGWNCAKLHDSTLETAFEAWRVCLKPRVLAVDVMLRKLTQIRNLALSCEGHSYDLIIALADEAIAMETRQGGDVKQAPSRSDDSAGRKASPKGGTHANRK